MFYEIEQYHRHNNAIRSVDITFKNEKINDENFNTFIDDWNNLDKSNEDFALFFNTEYLIQQPSIKYAFNMSSFIKRKKKQKIQYLKYSIIYVSSKSTMLLLRIIFNISSPIAPVYIIDYNDIERINNLRDKIERNEDINKPDIKVCFKP